MKYETHKNDSQSETVKIIHKMRLTKMIHKVRLSKLIKIHAEKNIGEKTEIVYIFQHFASL